jgi:hypothetical protein
MPLPDPSFGWQDATAAFAIIAVVAFLVTWVVTDLGHVSRTPYVAILTVTNVRPGRWLPRVVGHVRGRPRNGGVGLGHPCWFDHSRTRGSPRASLARRTTSPRGLSARWTARLRGGHVRNRRGDPARDPAGPGCVAGNLGARMDRHHMGEGGLWRTRGGRSTVRDLVHHLGYREFRTRAARKMLRGALVGCGLQALAFLLTGNVFAPVVPHIVLHTQLTLRGNEMPPATETRPAPLGPGLSRPTKAAAPKKELVA